MSEGLQGGAPAAAPTEAQRILILGADRDAGDLKLIVIGNALLQLSLEGCRVPSHNDGSPAVIAITPPRRWPDECQGGPDMPGIVGANELHDNSHLLRLLSIKH